MAAMDERALLKANIGLVVVCAREQKFYHEDNPAFECVATLPPTDDRPWLP
jgi:hypothetical protein